MKESHATMSKKCLVALVLCTLGLILALLNINEFFDGADTLKSILFEVDISGRNITGDKEKSSLKAAELQKKVLIVTWTNFFGQPMTHEHYMAGCPLNCVISHDRKDVSKASAVVFHGRGDDLKYNELPPIRFPEQRYVFLSHESPHNTGVDFKQIPHFFNWTMTYRLDSDVPMPYGSIKQSNDKKETSDILKIKQFLPKKNRLVAWFVSNCGTAAKREYIVTVLQEFIPVDIFGRCGNPKVCNLFHKAECTPRMLNENYKFYIAFENSICKDYITEKYWARWQLYSVPIVLRRSIYENQVPPNSFIAVDDFKSPKELAEYLLKLDKNDTAYLEYFQWRTQGFEPTDRDGDRLFGFCGLCQKLLNGTDPPKVYTDMGAWWTSDAQCDAGILAADMIRAHLNKKDLSMSDAFSSVRLKPGFQ